MIKNIIIIVLCIALGTTTYYAGENSGKCRGAEVNEIEETEILEEISLPTETTMPTYPIEETEADIVIETTPVIEETVRVYPEEYEYSVIVWEYLIDNGYTEEVAAGILGNIMAECGGQSLKLIPEIYGGNYYGICQWNKWDFAEVQGTDIYFQLDYLRDTIEYQMGSHYDGFCEMDNPRDAALSFAKFYERCASGTYTIRQSNAERAYEFFVNNK